MQKHTTFQISVLATNQHEKALHRHMPKYISINQTHKTTQVLGLASHSESRLLKSGAKPFWRSSQTHSIEGPHPDPAIMASPLQKEKTYISVLNGCQATHIVHYS